MRNQPYNIRVGSVYSTRDRVGSVGSMEETHSVGSSRGTSRSAGSRHSHNSRTSRKTCSSGESRAPLKLVDNMYLDTKTNMLEIIKEGLQLKLEIKSIKEQFLSLLQNYDQFDQQTGTMPAGALASAAKPKSTSGSKGLSAARARVRALYDSKKQRIQARRAAIGLTDKVAPPSKHTMRQAFQYDDEDKENQAVGLPPRLKARAKLSTSAPPTHPRPHHRHGKFASAANTSNLLTPIKEEVRNNVQAFHSNVSSPVISDIEGEYVLLKPLSNERCGDYMNVSPDAPFQSIQAECDLNTTSIWINTVDNLKATQSATKDNNMISPLLKGMSPIRDSPVKYATSDAISELYTSKSLRDVSQISRISHSSLHEQVSGTNLNVSGAFHSTFNYPLHSTLRYPLNSTLAMDLPDDITMKSCDEAEAEAENNPASDARTTISEPSVVMRSRSLSPMSPNHIETQTRNLDSSYMDKFQPVNNNNNGEFKLPRLPKKQRVKKTPQTQVPMLCKEHGLHPNFGGPCIFQTDDSFTLSDDSQDELESYKKRNSRATATETDCDSSYLSECMETESHGGMGFFGEAEEMTATYDARNGRMKMLRRQTGQHNLQQNKSQLRVPIGLSESDFFDASSFDITRKHLSLEATRSSLPDLSALSTPPSEEADNSESTLHASKQNSSTKENSCHRIGKHSPPVSLDNTLTSSDIRSDQRPLSIATSTSNTSPDSNTGCQVPANSPNITDTNSSSRPNTDNYDYVEVPIQKYAMMQQLQQQQASRPPAHINPPRRRRTTPSRSACTLPRQETVEQLADNAAANPVRKCLRYNHDYDSGFSTPGSRRMQGRHITITDNAGSTRTVVQHSAVARNLQKERKRQLVKKLKQFNNNFHTAQSTGNLQNIRTLGHF